MMLMLQLYQFEIGFKAHSGATEHPYKMVFHVCYKIVFKVCTARSTSRFPVCIRVVQCSLSMFGLLKIP